MKEQSEEKVTFIRKFCSKKEIRTRKNESHTHPEVSVTDNVVVCLIINGLTWSAYGICPSVRDAQRHSAK